ncbi:hypothetical protein CANARDRAFT_7878 [[Candida] arabinofermentans NRRL YB-2248]|uniref:dolichol kinase n=1 Tax=[Candida] arabinofermentans NRRL YB-2248 TaxID=983967 RepID=A0A1E4T0F4_9ASCO|nr:hypothetical protein CANARDRAFT_7878 [[Candida] arabinofermentans NRRL YB-2248]
MPPRKSKNSAKSGQATQRATRSSTRAAAKIDQQEVQNTEPTETNELQPELNDGPVDESKMTSIQYAFELVESSMTINYFVQWLLVLFMCNIIYLAITPLSDSDPMLVQAFYNCFVILMSVLAQLAMVLHAQWRRYSANAAIPDDDERKLLMAKPTLPEFNIIYAIILPVFLALLISPEFVPLIGGCVTMSTDIQLPGKTVAAFITEYQAMLEPISRIGLLVTPIIHFSTMYLVDRFGGKSFLSPEKNLFATLFVVVIFCIDSNSDITLIILQKLILSFLLATFTCAPAYYLLTRSSNSQFTYLLSVGIHTLFYGVGIFVTNNLLSPILGTNPFTWLSLFINQTDDRLLIFKTWSAAFAVGIPVVFAVSSYLPLDVRRKVWHFALFGAISYPMIVDPQLASLALVGLFGIFVILEMQRATELKPFGKLLQKALSTFQDEKDSIGPIVPSYIYLVLGVALPIWLGGVTGRDEALSGLVTIGLGDALASLIGKRYGTHYWPSSKKTIEGSLAFGIASLIGLFGFRYFGQNSYSLSTIVISTFTSAVLEGVSTMNDNVIIPVWMMISLIAVEKVQ